VGGDRRWDERLDARRDAARGTGHLAAVDDEVAQIVEDLLATVLRGSEVEELGRVFDQRGRRLSRLELGVAQHVEDEGRVGLHTADARLRERTRELIGGGLEGESGGSHLHQHRVVVRRDGRSRVSVAAVEADAKAFGRAPHLQPPRVWSEVLSHVLSRHARLDGVATLGDRVLAEADLVELLASRHADLRLDQIDASDHLRHRVLHLDARVDLDEVVLPCLRVDEELHRARVHVAGAGGDAHGVGVERLRQLVRQSDRRRRLNDLLVAALH